jgi:hypothetical protein
MERSDLIEMLGISITIVGSLAVSILGSLGVLSADKSITALLGLLGAFAVYQLASNNKLQREFRKSRTSESSEVLQKEWYVTLQKAIVNAERLDITSHKSDIPVTSGVEPKGELWNQLVKKKMTNPAISIRWIVRISNRQKLEWVETIIRDNKENENLSVNLSPVELRYHAPPMSVQIVDRKTAFAFDLAEGEYAVSQMGKGLVSSDAGVVDYFQTYFDEYWRRTEPLKEGRKVNWEKLEDLRAHLPES